MGRSRVIHGEISFFNFFHTIFFVFPVGEAAECANVSRQVIGENLCGRRKRTKWKAPGELEGQWFRVKRQRLDTDALHVDCI